MPAPLVPPAAIEPSPVGPGDVSGVQAEVVRAAQRLVGKHGEITPEEFIRHVLRAAGVGDLLPPGDKMQGFRRLYERLYRRGLTFDSTDPLPGDLVFFHNTFDADGDGRNNDWYTLAGVVLEVRAGGTVQFASVRGGAVDVFSLNLRSPGTIRDERTGVVLNSALRRKSLADPEYTQYLAGELFAGYASVVAR